MSTPATAPLLGMITVHPLGASGRAAWPTARPLIAVSVSLGMGVILEMLQQITEDFLADGNPGFNDVRSILAPGGRAKGLGDLEDAGHTPGEFFDEFLGSDALMVDHVPEGMGEGIRSPAKFVGVVQTVTDQLRPGWIAG